MKIEYDTKVLYLRMYCLCLFAKYILSRKKNIGLVYIKQTSWECGAIQTVTEAEATLLRIITKVEATKRLDFRIPLA